MAAWLSQLIRQMERMSTEQWLLIFIAAMIVGAISLRGFGSRSNY